MKISEFKKLEESVKEQDFNKSFKNINKVMFVLSIFGHFASIFLAYFMVSKILSGAITDNPILVGIASFILLGGLELLKREIFDKFSLQQIKYKSVTKPDVLPLAIVSLVIVSISFYASIKGAQEFSSKSKEIENKVDVDIKSYADSLKNTFRSEVDSIRKNYILPLQSEMKDLRSKREDLETKRDNALSRRERNDYKSDIANLDETLSKLEDNEKKYESEIKELETKTTSDIEKFTKSQKDIGTEKKTENKDNSFFFVIISTLIELVILFGVYFNEYFKFRSYSDFKEKIEKDDNYRKWHTYNSLLDVIMNQDTKINDKLPSMKVISDVCKVNGNIFLNKDLVSALKLFTTLGIIRASGSTKYIAKTKDTSIDLLRRHFKIE